MSPSGKISEAMVEARELLNAFSIYTIEDEEDVCLSTGGYIIAHYSQHTPKGIALLKLDAHCRAFTAALSVPTPGTGGAETCATEGCGKPSAVHFIRGDVGSYFCADCYSRIHAGETERLAKLSSSPVGEMDGWQTMDSAPKDEEVLIAYWRWRNSMSPGTIVVQSASLTEHHGAGIWSWVVSDNKHGPFPIRGWSEGDMLGWRPLPASPQGVR